MGGKKARGRGDYRADLRPREAPGLPGLDGNWAVEDAVTFDPSYDDDDPCIIGSAAEAVVDALRAISPRRENSPLRWLEPVMDGFERAQRKMAACSLQKDSYPQKDGYPSRGTRAADKRSL